MENNRGCLLDKKNSTYGFTLIELLAVIVILAIITLITVPLILNVIETAKKGSFKDTAYGLIESAELYYSKQQLAGNNFSTTTITFPDLGELNYKGERPKEGSLIINKKGKIALAIANGKSCIKKGFHELEVTVIEHYEECTVDSTNKVTDLILSTNTVQVSATESQTVTVKIEPEEVDNDTLKWTSKNPEIATVENGVIIGKGLGDTVITVETLDGSNIKKEIVAHSGYTHGIMKSADGCIVTGVCNPGVEVIVQVNARESYHFYVVTDSGTELGMIMNQNIGDNVAWCNQEDFLNAGGTQQDWNDYYRSKMGPITATNYLKSQTSSWTNISSDKIELPSGYTLTNALNIKTSNNQEWDKYACFRGIIKNSPWLIENIRNVSTTQGYWLMEQRLCSSGKSAWIVDGADIDSSDLYIDSYYGIRPYITISK